MTLVSEGEIIVGGGGVGHFWEKWLTNTDLQSQQLFNEMGPGLKHKYM